MWQFLFGTVVEKRHGASKIIRQSNEGIHGKRLPRKSTCFTQASDFNILYTNKSKDHSTFCLVFQATVEPSAVSIADMSCSTDLPDEPVQNGGDSIEEIIER